MVCLERKRFGCLLRLLIAFLLLAIAALALASLSAKSIERLLALLLLIIALFCILIVLVIVLLGKDAFFKRLSLMGTRSRRILRTHMFDAPQQHVTARVLAKRRVQVDTADPPLVQWFASFVLESGEVKEFEIHFYLYNIIEEGQCGKLIFREKDELRHLVLFKPHT